MKINFSNNQIRSSLAVLLLCFLIVSCVKEADEVPCTIVYELIADGNPAPEYNIQYLHSDGTEFSVGTFTSPAWQSNPIAGFEKGDVVRITVDNQSGTTSYTLKIRKNGILLDKEVKSIGSETFTLERVIPNI